MKIAVQDIGHIELDKVADDDGNLDYLGVVYDGKRPYTIHGYNNINELTQAMIQVHNERVAKGNFYE